MTAIANCVDGASVSIPAHAAGEAPVGFMLTGAHGSDPALLALAGQVKRHLRDDQWGE